MESKNSIKYREYLDLLLRWCCWVSITFYLSWCFRNDLSQCDLLIWEDTNYGLSHRLMLISLANNHIWESTYIDSLLTLFLSVCCIFSSFVRKLSFVRFCYESCLRFNFECKTKTHKSQERIELTKIPLSLQRRTRGGGEATRKPREGQLSWWQGKNMNLFRMYFILNSAQT